MVPAIVDLIFGEGDLKGDGKPGWLDQASGYDWRSFQRDREKYTERMPLHYTCVAQLLASSPMLYSHSLVLQKGEAVQVPCGNDPSRSVVELR